jgi:hypothetical protein
VRLNGLVFEAIAARLQHRGRADLYHSALEVYVPEGRFVIEQAPAWGTSGERGVVAQGPVGIRSAGRFRLFGYEVRRWRDGVIPDVDSAVESPQRLSEDPERARRLLGLVPELPTPVWGRDELRTGETWNSNLVAARPERPRRVVDPPSGWRTRARMACRNRGRAAPDTGGRHLAEGTLREHHRGHARPPAVTPPRPIRSLSGISVVAVTRAYPWFPLQTSMVRRGSTVRVRQRACKTSNRTRRRSRRAVTLEPGV